MEDPLSRIVVKVNSHLGDVITEDMSEKEIEEEVWTLCHDAASELGFLYPEETTKLAKEAKKRVLQVP